ncbi:phosphate regulon sensor histidine kinase PhoR [Neptunomonas antarctica]|uniref:Phosphate regulon sensor protein PhoR n=1 Tax=Neptunomonas antarctica TaxID=619304 RepID=A0A1N7IS46_9GAMM|nr:phosphate regulon sensor histidine kinase PhoR [Neptunomonas antarctica]SIS39826.1 PAS/PAC sensor signal transduction histidine kinase [Neptunomonas antarctica]
MQKSSHAAFGDLLIVALVSATIGLAFGSLSWGLVIGLSIWCALQIRQIEKLRNWLHQSDTTPPESQGHWGEIFDDLARLQKRHKTKTKQLKEIIVRFQQSSSALSDAFVIIDNHNNLEWWNLSADRLLGLKASADRGKPVMNLLRDPRFVRYYRKGNYEDPLQLPSPVLNETILQYQITEFGFGDRLLVARDITQLVRLEQTRQDFVANASHELRTPLTVISGYLETFLDQELSKPIARAMTQMQIQAHRMENLVSDLLLLSRLEASQHIADENPINIHRMLRTIVHDAEILAADKGHTITWEADEEYDLLGQPQELHSAFSNLVFNAVRYSPERGQIDIRWWMDQQGGHFSVKDNGLGIESIHLSRLTERFYRVDEGRSSSTGGTGLGLAIVKHALYRHGARLTIESQPGKGSLFSCHFPVEMLTKIAKS